MHLYSMPRSLFIALALLAHLGASAQFDLGISGGGYVYSLRAKDADGGRATASFGSDQAFPWSVAMHYRERGDSQLRFASEVMVLRREFRVVQSYGGLGSGNDEVWDVRLDQLYWGILPEIYLDAKKMSVLRFGAQFGWALNATKEGIRNSWSGIPPSTSKEEFGRIPADYGGDIRALLGIGYRLPLKGSTSVVLDAFVSSSVTSMGGGPVAVRSSDAGLRAGISWTRPGQGLWPALRKGAPKKP